MIWSRQNKDSVEQKFILANCKIWFFYSRARDPLYTSWIALGDKKKIFGIIPSFFRNAPPGINMNTSPRLKKYTDIAKVWYFSENNVKQIALFQQMGSFFDPKIEPLLEHNGARLWKTIRH